MNIDHILDTMNKNQVSFILIGGMNFLLRHVPLLTFDIDLWIEETNTNRDRCEKALSELHAEWGSTDKDWKLVSKFPKGWLETQPIFCLTSPYGAIDIFRFVKGLEDWQFCRVRALEEKTASGISYLGLSDNDMLKCQLALDPKEQKNERIIFLQSSIQKSS